MDPVRSGPVLSVRLSGVAGLIPTCRRVIDVGSDHAYLPIHLVKVGRCITAIARDVREGPVAVARRNIAKSRTADRVFAEVADGLDGMDCLPDDVVVVAGLGGLETADILERNLAAARTVAAIVLQPMKSLPDLRAYLLDRSFLIEREEVAFDAGRFYTCLRCRAGREGDPPTKPYDDFELLVGRDLIDRRPESLVPYLASLRRRLEKEIRGLSASTEPVDQVAVRHRAKWIARIDTIDI
jgi:tRNA (adenine22-N1)-methyltransferase